MDASGRGWDADFGADEVREVWDGDIQPIAAELLPPDVSPATRRFLTEVGLPTVEEAGIVFARDDRLSSTIHRRGRELLPVTVVGVSGLNFGIDVRSDEVFHFDKSPSDYLGFFNSNIAALVFFHGLLRKDVLSLRDVEQEVVEDAIESVRNVMEARDPAAMEDLDRGWNEILDEGYVT